MIRSPLLIVSLVILLILIELSCSTKKNYFPEKISNLLLVKTISGKEAYDLINKLHFQPVAQGSSEIGFYENLSGSAVIYITHYKSKKDAKVYFDKMTEKIPHWAREELQNCLTQSLRKRFDFFFFFFFVLLFFFFFSSRRRHTR